MHGLHASGGYAGCQLFLEAARRAGSQTANKGLLVQSQDGAKVVAWPDRFATVKPRFPTPAWSQR